MPHWLRARPEVDGLIFEWLAQPSTRRSPESHRSRLAAALAHGYSRAGRPERAAELYAQAPAPGGPAVASDWAPWIISEGRAPEARALLVPWAQTAPASWLLSWMDADALHP